MKQTKKINSNKKKKVEWIYPVLLIVSVYFLVLTVFSIGGNIQTIDTVYNFVNVGNCLNQSVTDMGSDFVERNLVDYYIIGMNDLKRNILMSILLSLIIGYLAVEIGRSK